MTAPAAEPTTLAHLESEAHAWPTRPRALAATDPAGHPRAADFLLRLKGVRAAIARASWTAVVVSLRVLCQAVGEGRVPETAVLPNGATLNAAARAMKSAFNWPGCRAVRTTVVAAGRR